MFVLRWCTPTCCFFPPTAFFPFRVQHAVVRDAVTWRTVLLARENRSTCWIRYSLVFCTRSPRRVGSLPTCASYSMYVDRFSGSDFRSSFLRMRRDGPSHPHKNVETFSNKNLTGAASAVALNSVCHFYVLAPLLGNGDCQSQTHEAICRKRISLFALRLNFGLFLLSSRNICSC
jgi:hypothetical protein